MLVKELKELIKDLPDDTEIVVDTEQEYLNVDSGSVEDMTVHPEVGQLLVLYCL